MTTKDYEATCTRIRTIFDRWRPLLGLDQWLMHRNFYDDIGDYTEAVDPLTHPRLGVERSVARAVVAFEYMEASLYFCVPHCHELDDRDLTLVVLHECCHVLVNEMRYVADCACNTFNIKHEERVVTSLAWALLWTAEHFAPKPPYVPSAEDCALW